MEKKINKKAAPPKAETEKVKKPLHKKWQFWTGVAVAVAIIVLTLVTVCDYSILSACIRAACKPKGIQTPDNYEAVLSDTEAKYDISYESEAENGYFDIFSPKGVSGRLPTVVYIHGGYYLGGDKASAEPYCRVLAQAGFVVVSLNYALAPEAKYPTQARQVNEAIAFLVKNKDEYHVDSKQIFIGGDSAGGHLSAQMGAFYTNKELADKMRIKPAIEAGSLKGVILLCGFYNMKTVGECKFPFFNTAMWAFTDERDYNKFSRVDEMSVVDNVTEKYPDAFVACGSDDPFYTQAEELVKVFEKNKVGYVSYLPKSDKNKLKHEFQRDFTLPECGVAMDMLIEFLKARSKNEAGKYSEARAVFALDTGDTFTVRLYPEFAPETVANFIKYAEYGYYDNTYFHRIIPGQVLQGGGYEKNADGELVLKSELYPPIKGEFSSNGFSKNSLKHYSGTISMARADDKDSATSQFFFCAVDINDYNGEYAAFGQIIEGADALGRLVSAEVKNGDQPVNPVKLLSVRIVYKG